ncbi:MAG: VWA domain-containing protein [Desulfobacterales bacterium]
MLFSNPYMLLTLGIIPILILIHVLRPKPRPVEVTNLLFWQEALKERNRRMTFARLINNLPLLLQILIVLLATLALAKPTWTHLSVQKGNLILVMDTSASMQTRSGSGTRFDLAKEKALELIEQSDPNQKIMIVEAGRQAVLKTGFTDSSSRAEDIVRKLAPSDAAAGLEPAVYLALSFVDPAAEDLVYLVTDGADPDIAGLVKNHPKLRPIIVGEGGRNVGITKFEFRQYCQNDARY